jgi:hypothetical protein
VDPRSGPTGDPASEPRSLPRQRWRLVLARSADAPDLAGREVADAWDQAIESTELPLHRSSQRGRARVTWGAPLPARMAAEHELAEILLADTLPVWRVRDELTSCLPAGWRLVDLYDIWLGAPALAGRVTGAVYRVTLDGEVDGASVSAAAARLLDSTELRRTRLKGGAMVPYDLRPLLARIDLITPGPPVVIRVEVRIHPERGSGRPEEVVAALADEIGRAIGCEQIVRERLAVAEGSG